MHQLKSALNRYFGISAAQSSITQELRGGFTTFAAMAYILFVNPQILSQAIILPQQGFGQLMTATALTAAFGSILMGLLARYPYALAPGMGLNAYFAYSVVLGNHLPWQTALGAVFLSGLGMFILTLTGVRRAIIAALPESLKVAISAGIGLFLTLLGLKNCGMIEGSSATLLQLGSLAKADVHLAAAGGLLTLALLHYRWKGAMLLGIIFMSVAALVWQLPVYDGQHFNGIAGGWWQAPAWPVDLVGALDVWGAIQWGGLGILVTFTLVDLFDTAGTLLGLAQLPGGQGRNMSGRSVSHAFAADALATAGGALLGTSTATTYVESGAGIQDGARTGLAAVWVGLLFFLSVFLWPLAQAVPLAATAPALLIVGCLMMASVARVPWHNLSQALPAFITMVMIPYSFSIADGITAGTLSYLAINLVAGKLRAIHPFLYAIGGALALRLYYVQGGV